MIAFSWVGVFVKARSVKLKKAVGIPWKMRRNPVDIYSNIRLMQFFNQVHQVLRIPHTRGTRKITRELITPRWRIGVFHDWHKLNVREAHFLHIRHQFFGHFTIIEIAVWLVGITNPRTNMHFINRDGRVKRIVLLTIFHPILVFPFVVSVPND